MNYITYCTLILSVFVYYYMLQSTPNILTHDLLIHSSQHLGGVNKLSKCSAPPAHNTKYVCYINNVFGFFSILHNQCFDNVLITNVNSLK